MKISINNFEGSQDNLFEPPKQRCFKIRSSLYFLSIGRILAILSTLIVIGCILILCKAYIKFVLLWLEKQDDLIVAATICVLFVIVSLPISVGYIVLVLASGYLFGVLRGLMLEYPTLPQYKILLSTNSAIFHLPGTLLLVVCGANVGLFIAHNILKVVGHHPSIYRFTQNNMAVAIMQVISGPLCFKIVFCSRLTPIPFGLQNTIFALSNVSAKIYHIASLLGLFPAQFVAVYVGSTLRSMQDVIENNHISSTTYFFAVIQLICGASLMIWIGSKARAELLKVLAEAENSSSKSAAYSMV